MNISIEKKRSDCPALSKGWQREEVLRKTGLSAGKVDVYYYRWETGKFILTNKFSTYNNVHSIPFIISFEL